MSTKSRVFTAPNGCKVRTAANKTYIVVMSGFDQTVGNFACVVLRTDSLETALIYIRRASDLTRNRYTLFRKADGKRAVGVHSLIRPGKSTTSELTWEDPS